MRSEDHPGSWGNPSNPHAIVQSIVADPQVWDEFLGELQKASTALERASDLLYKPDGIRRGLGYRLRLNRLQSATMTIFVHETNRKQGRITDGRHEWEYVNDHWECIYCERHERQHMLFGKIFFKPDVLRHIPIHGQRWRCDG